MDPEIVVVAGVAAVSCGFIAYRVWRNKVPVEVEDIRYDSRENTIEATVRNMGKLAYCIDRSYVRQRGVDNRLAGDESMLAAKAEGRQSFNLLSEKSTMQVLHPGETQVFSYSLDLPKEEVDFLGKIELTLEGGVYDLEKPKVETLDNVIDNIDELVDEYIDFVGEEAATDVAKAVEIEKEVEEISVFIKPTPVAGGLSLKRVNKLKCLRRQLLNALTTKELSFSCPIPTDVQGRYFNIERVVGEIGGQRPLGDVYLVEVNYNRVHGSFIEELLDEQSRWIEEEGTLLVKADVIKSIIERRRQD